MGPTNTKRVACLLITLVACKESTSGIPDTSAPEDAGVADIERADMGQDLGPVDTGQTDGPDVGFADMGETDLGLQDTGPVDMGAPDLGPMPTHACTLLSSPTTYLPSCSGLCEPHLEATTTGWLAGYLAHVQRLDANGQPEGTEIDLIPDFAERGFSTMSLAPGFGANGGSFWALFTPRPNSAPHARLAFYDAMGAETQTATVGVTRSSAMSVTQNSLGGLGVMFSQGTGGGFSNVLMEARDASGAPLFETQDTGFDPNSQGAFSDIEAINSTYLACAAYRDTIGWVSLTFDGMTLQATPIPLNAVGDSPRCGIVEGPAGVVGVHSGSDSSYLFDPNTQNTTALTNAAFGIPGAGNVQAAGIAKIDQMNDVVAVAFLYAEKVAIGVIGWDGQLASLALDLESVGNFRSRPVIAARPNGTLGIAWRSGQNYRFATARCDPL